MKLCFLVFLFLTATLSPSSCAPRRPRSVSVVQVRSAVDILFERISNFLDKSVVFALEIAGAKAMLAHMLTSALISVYSVSRPYVRPALQVTGTLLLAYELVRYFGNGRTAFGPVYKLFGDVAGSLGVGVLAKVLRYARVSPAHAETFSTWFQECKNRSYCELGASFSKFSYWMTYLGDFKSRFPRLTAFLDGLEGMDCEVLYPDCPYASRSEI